MVTPKQTDPQFKLRLPAELKEQIEQAAEENNRSMNAEIVARLESSFVFGVSVAEELQLMDKIAELAERVVKRVREEERREGKPPLDYDPK